MRRLVFSLCLLLSFCIPLKGQLRPDLAGADKFARSVSFPVKDRQALDSLVRMVEKRFSLDEEKIRAMFTWVATNLEYDCGNDTTPPLKAVSVDQVLLSGKSQCAGYSNLLQYSLKKMGYEVVTVKGVAKTAKKDLWWTERDLRPNHSWNAVKLAGEWKLLDATWASGAADDDCKTVNREFSSFYFFPEPHKFQLSHLPVDSSWQLTTALKRDEFLSIPVFHDPYYEHAISAFAPVKGVLDVKLNDVVEFVFNSKTPLGKVAVWCEENKAIRPEFGVFTRRGDNYRFSYRVKYPGNYFLNVSLDGRRTAMVYYLRVNK